VVLDAPGVVVAVAVGVVVVVVVVTVTVWPVATVVTVVAAPLDNVTVAIEVVPDLVVVEVNEMVPVPWLVFAWSAELVVTLAVVVDVEVVAETIPGQSFGLSEHADLVASQAAAVLQIPAPPADSMSPDGSVASRGFSSE